MIYACMYVCVYVERDPEDIQKKGHEHLPMQCVGSNDREIFLLVEYFTVSMHFILITNFMHGNKVREHIQKMRI